MERNIGDQLNKAFEAYRQVSIEKDIAKNELQKMTEYYEGYTRQLQQQIEEQQKFISVLQEKLSALSPAPGEMKSDPCDHLVDGAGAYRKLQYQDNIVPGAAASSLPLNFTVECRDMQEAFEAIQVKFRKIQSLTRRQKDHLKRFSGGTDSINDQRFSMPIQCTDRTAEPERPFSSALRNPVDAPLTATSLASRGADPEDRDLDSLTKFSVKFPPPADSEYDFLNSAPDRHLALTAKPSLGSASMLSEEEPVEAPGSFVYSTSPCLSAASSLSQESVRGPQQSVWSPDLSAVVDMSSPQSSSPDKCAFCQAVVPPDKMNIHLYSHFSHKTDHNDHH